MVGYSGTPLAQKLGIKPESTLIVLGAPAGFDAELGELPDGVRRRDRAQGTADVVITFHEWRADLEERVPKLLDVLDVDGGLWISWPKKASKQPTDITEDTVREVGLPTGMVDNKVCAIDDTWSGLRLVVRKADRAAWAVPPSRG